MAEEHRRADWLELFFDLVFVVTVSVLAHDLHGDPGPKQFGVFLVLFFPAWWAWVNLMISVNLFGGDRFWTRLMLIFAMPGIGLMAAAVPHGLDNRAWAFAVGGAWVRLCVFAIWWIRGRRVETTIPWWRPVSYCMATAGLWLTSAFVPSPARFILWALAIAVEVLLLSIESGGSPQLFGRFSVEHLVERVSLFVVIVFGESVFAMVVGLEEQFTVRSGVAAFFAFVVVATLAISYFRWSVGMAESRLGQAQSRLARSAMRDAVMYLPFVLITTIVFLAAALGTAIAEPEHHLPPGSVFALTVGIAGFYATNALISWRLGTEFRTIPRWVIPAIALPLIVILPLSGILPAWGLTIAAASSVVAMFTYSSLTAPRAADVLVS